MGSTIIEKILAKASGKSQVTPGDKVWAKIDLTAMRDFGGPNVILEYKKHFGDRKVHDARKTAITFDLHLPAKTTKVAENQKVCRDFAKEQEIKLFDINTGIGQHILYENGLVKSWDVIVGTDSHMNLLGAFGAFASGVGTTDIVASLAFGKLWFRVPESIKVNVEGALRDKVSAKDVILHILKEIKSDGALYKSVEFSGSAIDAMNTAGRITLTSMVTEMSGKTAFISTSKDVIDDLNARTKVENKPIRADEDAEYGETFEFEVNSLEPMIACPHSPDNVKGVREVEGTPIDQVFVGSCTNGRFEDLLEVANILKGEKVAENTRMIIVPATREVAERALSEGLYKIFFKAGAVVCNPSCALCTIGHPGVLAPDETTLSTSNRNFPGKIGKGGKVYLVSPATAASSAIKGVITDPRGE